MHDGLKSRIRLPGLTSPYSQTMGKRKQAIDGFYAEQPNHDTSSQFLAHDSAFDSKLDHVGTVLSLPRSPTKKKVRQAKAGLGSIDSEGFFVEPDETVPPESLNEDTGDPESREKKRRDRVSNPKAPFFDQSFNTRRFLSQGAAPPAVF